MISSLHPSKTIYTIEAKGHPSCISKIERALLTQLEGDEIAQRHFLEALIATAPVVRSERYGVIMQRGPTPGTKTLIFQFDERPPFALHIDDKAFEEMCKGMVKLNNSRCQPH